MRLQIKIVGSEIVGGAGERPFGLGNLKRRLDDCGDAGRDLILKVEYIFQRAVEPIGPEMRADFRLDQLPSDAHSVAGFPHTALEHVAHAEFERDLLYIDRLAFIGEGRIASDDKEPRDTG